MLIVLLACAGPRVVDAGAAMAACVDGLSPVCVEQLEHDAAYVGPVSEAVPSALLALLVSSPAWYEATLSEIASIDVSDNYGDAVASTTGRHVTLHAPWGHPTEVLAAALVHESAHAARPLGGRHVPCRWATGCDDGDELDGYPMIVDYLQTADLQGWHAEIVTAIQNEAIDRSGW